MGCDIHFYVEKKVNGKWKSADSWKENKFAGEAGEPDLELPYENSFYQGRNYDLFAILANVRNGRGFAGVYTGEGFNPISDPKGLPSDLSKELKAESDYWDCDGHSHTHFTLKELLDYDWTQETMKLGVIPFQEWLRWSLYEKGNGDSPTMYCASTNANTMSKDEAMEKIRQLKGLEELDAINHLVFREIQNRTKGVSKFDFYVKDSWKTSYSKSASEFLSQTMPRLLKLAEGQYEDVRVVFWFDN